MYVTSTPNLDHCGVLCYCDLPVDYRGGSGGGLVDDRGGSRMDMISRMSLSVVSTCKLQGQACTLEQLWWGQHRLELLVEVEEEWW